MKKQKGWSAAPVWSRRKTVRIFSILFLLCLAVQGALTAAGTSLTAAREAFAQGRFVEAGASFQAALDADGADVAALLGLGRVRLLQNRLDEAEKLLQKVLALDAENKEALGPLAEAYFRRERYHLAAPLLRAAGREPQAKQLEAFKGLEPYAFETAPDSSVVPFEITDPLPVVKLKVNDQEAEFIIDTGGASLILDPEFAALVGTTRDAEIEGIFAGGLKRQLGIGRADKVEIGGYRLRHVPIATLPMGPIAAMFGRPLKGVVGTCFLYHFIFTLDYPGGRLVLQRRDRAASEALAAANRDGHGFELPLWLAGDHFIVARGRVNASPEVACFLDTGMANGGIGLSEAMAKEAGVELPTETREGIGGGGTVRVRPIVAKEVRLGEVLVRDVRGNIGSGPVKEEFSARLGFRMPVIVSHAFFRGFRATFDLLGMRLLLTPAAPGGK